MAQMLAPYNNSMRLGQGFNSYTQQICLDRAVLLDNAANRRIVESRYRDKPLIPLGANASAAEKQREADIEEQETRLAAIQQSLATGNLPDEPPSGGDDLEDAPQVPPWVKAQIVTYSSRFVDKLSDVTDAMNISGSLSIKTATIGGKANGSYVDSDKFKESDINFHLQVKVTNQINNREPYTLFNRLAQIPTEEFTPVYGDSFISGFEEGGELNAIISIKVSDKAKIHEIKAGLEAELNVAAVKGKVTANVEITKNNIQNSAETTIAVNWAGGGSIKAPSDEWNIGNIKKAAAAFPDLVAITPQRTYAVLTKYTALESFHRQREIKLSPLNYENAGIYTAALLDHYMEYKVMWKQISTATTEFENNRARIEFGQPTEDLMPLAKIKALPAAQITPNLRKLTDAANSTATTDLVKMTSGTDSKVSSTNPDEIVFQPWKPSLAGLIAARKQCRIEMAKIVNEVDLIAKEPSFAQDPSRDEYFLHPLIFRQLLPIVRSWSADTVSGGSNPRPPAILGYDPPLDQDRTYPDLGKFEVPLKESLVEFTDAVNKLAKRGHHYRLHGCAGAVGKALRGHEFFNDLNVVEPTYRPVQLSIFMQDGYLQGIKIRYASGQEIGHGAYNGTATHILSLKPDGSEGIFELAIEAGVLKINDAEVSTVISNLRVTTTLYTTLDTKDPATLPPPSSDAKQDQQATEDKKEITSPRSYTFTKPDNNNWTLRGFFGLTRNNLPTALGVVWGKDPFVPIPAARVNMPLARSVQGLPNGMQDDLARINRERPAFAGNFLMGTYVTTMDQLRSTPVVKYFNGLENIELDYKIKTLTFCTKASQLVGLRVLYTNGQEVKHGALSDGTNWEVDTKGDLVTAKLSTVDSGGKVRIGSMEFVRSGADGNSAEWPLDTSTLRYLGETDPVSSDKITAVVEKAPNFDGARWSVRGFYGWERTDGASNPAKWIGGIGIIWGRG